MGREWISGPGMRGRMAGIIIPISQKTGLRPRKGKGLLVILGLEVAESRDPISDSPGIHYW